MKHIYINLITACCCMFVTTGTIKAEIEDVTEQYITNYNFTGDKTVWNIEQNAFNTDQRVNCQEFWSGDISNAWFKMGQTLKGLPKGVYRLCINGFTRAGGSETSQTAIYATTSEKEYMTPIWLRHKDTSYGSEPNSMDDASKAFYNTNGNYWLNTIDNIIVTDGTLTIGARNTGQLKNDGGAWTILGNVKLYSVTGKELLPLMQDNILKAESLINEGQFNGIENLETAVNTAKNINGDNLTLEDIENLTDAMYSYRNTRMSNADKNNGIDATHLLTNAGFENGAVFKTGTANGNYNEPKGWKLSYGSVHINNNCGVASTNIEQAGINSTISPTEGNWAFSSRMRWTTSSVITIEQEVELPAGSYTVKADMSTLGGSENPVFKVENDNGILYNVSVESPTFAEYESDIFTLNTKQKIKFSFTISQNGSTNAIAAIDNIRLKYWGTEDIVDSEAAQEKISELNILLDDFVNNYNNRVMQKNIWTTLINEIENAELTKDKNDITVEDVTNCINKIQATMTDAAISVEAYGLLYNNIAMMKTLNIKDLDIAIAKAETVYKNANDDSDIVKSAVTELQKAYLNAISQCENIVDVTAFIANPGFEEGHHSFPNNYMNVFEPYGWNADFEASNYGDSYKHLRCIAYDNEYDNITPARPDNQESGDKLLYMRNNWGSSTKMQIMQNITLPEGKYRISADVNHLSGSPSEKLLYIKVGTGNIMSLWPSTNNSWEKVSQEFDVKDGETVTLSAGFGSNGGNNLIALMADNFKLELLGISYMADYNKVLESAKKTLSDIDKETFTDIYNNLNDAINTDISAGTEEVYNHATEEIQKAMEWAVPAAKINTVSGDATDLIENPKADNGINGWTTENTGIRNEESFKGMTDNYFDGGNWSANSWTAYMEQEIKLPKGLYSLEVIARAENGVNYKVIIDGNEKTLKASSGKNGNIWEYADEESVERNVNNKTGFGWNKNIIGFEIDKNKVCRLRIEASANEQYQWFSVDDFKLTYVKDYGSVTKENNNVYADKAIKAEEISALIDKETRCVDLRNAKVIIGELVLPDNCNDNCIIYAPVGTTEETKNVVCNNICLDLVLADKQPFNNIEGFLARNASYTREAYMDGLYETLLIPFDAEFPDGEFVWEEIDNEYPDYITTKTTEDNYLKEGKPYLMRFVGNTGSNTVTQLYTAINVYIKEFTSPEATRLFGSTDIYYVSDNNNNIYMLSSKDGAFVKASSASYSAPFRACYKPETAMQNYINIRNNTTDINDYEYNEDKLVNVYNINGILIKKQVKAKEALQDLKSGIYIVGRKKVIKK